MRRFPKRSTLPASLRDKLAQETLAISAHSDPKSEASRRYTNARQAAWFQPVVGQLKKLSGKGQRCMLCSGSEASDVDHYRPKAVFPELAMLWANYLWICTPCNRSKGNRFPPETEPGGRLINPLDEDVWKFFFIDDFGLLTPRFDSVTSSFNQRAVTARDLLELNREGLQESRQLRLEDIKSQVLETLQLAGLGKISKIQIRAKIKKWRKQPFQPDVADYFLNGPGKAEPPFRELLAWLG